MSRYTSAYLDVVDEALRVGARLGIVDAGWGAAVRQLEVGLACVAEARLDWEATREDLGLMHYKFLLHIQLQIDVLDGVFFFPLDERNREVLNLFRRLVVHFDVELKVVTYVPSTSRQ